VGVWKTLGSDGVLENPDSNRVWKTPGSGRGLQNR